MKRFAFLVAMLVAGSLFAADREQFNVGKLYLNDVEVTATAAELNIMDGVTATAAELNIMDGVTATAAELNAVADASARVRAVSVTNGSTVTLTAAQPVLVFTGSGEANGGSNVVSLALPYPVGTEFTFITAAASTNTIYFADSTTVLALGSPQILDATDTLQIYTLATNSAVKVGGSDN